MTLFCIDYDNMNLTNEKICVTLVTGSTHYIELACQLLYGWLCSVAQFSPPS